MTLLLYDDDKNNDNRAVCLEIFELASTSFRSTALQRSDSLAAVVTKRCRLTNSALVYEPKCGGGGGAGSQPMSTAVHMEPK
jgi:hypothetical protein